MGSQGYFHDLRTHTLIDFEALCFIKISASERFADDRNLKIMLTGPDITGIDALYPSLLQGFEFLEGINMMGHRISVQLHAHGAVKERIADGRRRPLREAAGPASVQYLLFKGLPRKEILRLAFEEGFRIVYVGPLAASGVAILGS